MDLDPLLDHQAAFHALARSLVFDDATADDVVQEAWKNALETPSAQRPDAWLRGVIRNLSRRTHRDRARTRRRESLAARDERTPFNVGSLERLELQRDVIDAVLSLSEALREVVLMRYFEELSSAEIARRLDLPAATVRTRLKRGLDALRERLDREYGDRRSWGLALLPLAHLRPVPELAAGASSIGLGLFFSGGVFMTIQKLAIGLLVVGLTALAFFQFGPSGAVPADEPSNSSVTDTAVRSSRVDLTTETSPSNRMSTNAGVATSEAERALLRISGEVVTPVGHPVFEATVRVASGERSTTTDRVGRFLLELEAQPAGQTVQLEVEAGRERGPGSWAIARRLVVVSRDLDLDVGTITLEPGGAVEGTLRLDGVGVPDELITAIPGGTDNHRHFTTDAEGRFVAYRLPPGMVRLRVTLSELSTPRTVTVRVAAHETTRVDIDLESADPASTLSGVVLDADGNAVPFANLILRRPTGVRSAATDEVGAFSIAVKGQDAFTVEATSTRHPGERAALAGVWPGDELTLVLEPKPTLDLSFVDRHGVHLENVQLGLVQESEWGEVVFGAMTEKGSDGRIQLVLPISPTIIRVTSGVSEPADFGPVDTSFAGEHWEIVLERKPTVVVSVTHAGEPVAGARVSLHSEYGPNYRFETNGMPTLIDSEISSGRTGTNGRVHLGFDRDSERTLALAVEAEGLARSISSVHGDTVEIELVRGGSLEGRILAPATEELSGRLVAITNGDRKIIAQTVTPDGRYRFDGLAPGPWRLREYYPPSRSKHDRDRLPE